MPLVTLLGAVTGGLVVTLLWAVTVAACDLAMLGHWALFVALLCAVTATKLVTWLCAVTVYRW